MSYAIGIYGTPQRVPRRRVRRFLPSCPYGAASAYLQVHNGTSTSAYQWRAKPRRKRRRSARQGAGQGNQPPWPEDRLGLSAEARRTSRPGGRRTRRHSARPSAAFVGHGRLAALPAAKPQLTSEARLPPSSAACGKGNGAAGSVARWPRCARSPAGLMVQWDGPDWSDDVQRR